MRLAVAIAVVLAGCAANTNPFGVPDDEAATLQNRWEDRAGKRMSLIFLSYFDTGAERWRYLNPGASNRAVDAVFKLPAGEIGLRINVVQMESTSFVQGKPAWQAQVPVLATLRPGVAYVVDAEIEAGQVKAWVKERETSRRASTVGADRLSRF